MSDVNFQMHEPKRASKAPLVLFLLFIVALLIWVGVTVYAAISAAAALQDGQVKLEEAKEHALTFEFEEAKEDLSRAQVLFERGHDRLVFLRPLEVFPQLRENIRTVRIVSSSAEELSAGVREMVDLGADILALSGLSSEQIIQIQQGVSTGLSFDDLSKDTRGLILQRLASSQNDFELLDAKIDIARRDIGFINRQELFTPIFAALSPVEDALEELQSTVRALAITTKVVPPFVGVGEPSTSLILFLNNAELRPGGGFIGTFAILNMEEGEIINLISQDVYSLDNPAEPFITRTPPSPLTVYNASQKWFFRDSNWSPDFSASALQAKELFEQEQTLLFNEGLLPIIVRPEHVMAMTPTYASEVLKITGPVSAGGRTFTPENIVDLLVYEVEVGFEDQGLSVDERKTILIELIENTREKIFNLPLSDIARMFDVTKDAFENKQTVLYSTKEPIQDVIETIGWGGVIPDIEADVQMVVDANLASLKTDPVVERSIRYEIRKGDNGSYIGRTIITYNHIGSFDFKTTRYRTYTRLYTPKGTRFLRAQGQLRNDKIIDPSGTIGEVDVFEDLGMTVFGAFTSIEPQQTRELVFEYELADQIVNDIVDGDYKLDWIKQIGADDHTLTLDLDFDKNLTNASPVEHQDQWGDDIYRLETVLDRDLEFFVRL